MRLYLEMNALLILGLGGLWLTSRGTAPLRLARILFVACLLLPLASQLLPRKVLLEPAPQIWSGLSRLVPLKAASNTQGLSTASSTPAKAPLPLTDSAGMALALGIAGFLALYGLRVLRLRGHLRRAPLLKRVGRVEIRVSAHASSPYSAWLPGIAAVVIPERLLFATEERRIALKHELQHHRQGDTRWIHFLELAKTAFFWNPAVHGWVKALTEIQELACDENLIGHRGVSPRVYGRCLLQAAESAVGARALPAGTAGMAASASGHMLKRRITMLFSHSKKGSRKRLSRLAGLGTLLLLSSIAFATRSASQDRTLTLKEAEALAKTASAGATIPLTVTDGVLRKLNRYVGTSAGRRYVRDGLARMEAYRPMIERKLAEYSLPAELLAIPLYESSFQNDAISPPPYRAAGIWQFIPETARTYDLTVTESVDERTHPQKETDAAMRLYKDLYAQFGDWSLALIAYNSGNARLKNLMARHKTRDPWVIDRADRYSYLSGAVAMMILVKNPSILE